MCAYIDADAHDTLIQTHAHMQTQFHTFNKYIYTCKHSNTYTYGNILIMRSHLTLIYIHTTLSTCTHTYTHTNTHTLTHTYTYTHHTLTTHTQTHIYNYTSTYMNTVICKIVAFMVVILKLHINMNVN